jgi:hypothetical protein
VALLLIGLTYISFDKKKCCGSGSVAFFDPGILMGGKFGSGIRNEQPGSYFLGLRNHFLGYNFRDGKKSDPESGKTSAGRTVSCTYISRSGSKCIYLDKISCYIKACHIGKQKCVT